jgi:uncharacterized membrane protein
MEEKFKQTKLNRSILHLLGEKKILNASQLKNTFKETGIYPAKNQWLINLERFLLSLGIIFSLCGIVFFFAYNWQDMSSFFKLGLVQIITVIIALIAFFRPKTDFVYQIALTALCIMVGINFTVFGQIYQTGADAYDLFIAWTLLITIWVIISQFPPLWLFYLLLINVTIILYYGQVLGEWDNIFLLWILFIINTLAIIFWEYFRPFAYRWWPRVCATAAVFFISFGMMWWIIDRSEGMNQTIGVLIFISWLLMVLLGSWLYINQLKDLFMLILFYLSGIVLLNTFIIRNATEGLKGIEGVFFLCSFLTIGLTILMAGFLIRLNHQWKQHNQPKQATGGLSE